MDNMKMNNTIPAEMNDDLLEAVAAGESVPTMHPETLFAKFSDTESSASVPVRDKEDNLIYIIPTLME